MQQFQLQSQPFVDFLDCQPHLSAPYSHPSSRLGGAGYPLQAPAEVCTNCCLVLQDVPEAPSLLPALRPGAGTLGSQVNVIVNMYLLIVTGQLLHYDVQFEIVRSRRGAGAGAGESVLGVSCFSISAAVPPTCILGFVITLYPALLASGRKTFDIAVSPVMFIHVSAADPPRGDTASQGTIASFASSSTASTSSVKSYKPPANAREILMKFEEQYWSGRNQRVPYAFDGARNLVAPAPPPGLPDVENKKVVYKVDGVMLPGKETPTSWLVSRTSPQ